MKATSSANERLHWFSHFSSYSKCAGKATLAHRIQLWDSHEQELELSSAMNAGLKILERVLQRGIEEGISPGAVALVAQGGKIVFFEHVGYRSLVPERASMTRDTIFDLASLTKVFATVPTIMNLV